MRLHSSHMFDWKQDSHSLFFVSSFESIVRYSREYYAVSKLVISDSSTRSNLLNNNIKSPLLVELFSSEVSQPWCMYFGEYTQNLHTLMLLHSPFIFGSSGAFQLPGGEIFRVEFPLQHHWWRLLSSEQFLLSIATLVATVFE